MNNFRNFTSKQVCEFLPKLIQFIVKELSYSQKQIAERTNISPSQITNLKKGKEKEYIPDGKIYLQKISSAFYVNIDEFGVLTVDDQKVNSDSNSKIIDVKTEFRAEQALSHLFGNWLMYSGDHRKVIFKSKLKISNMNDIQLKSNRVIFPTGFIEIKGEGLYILLQGRRNVLITIGLRYRELNTITEFIGAYSTISIEENYPMIGVSLMKRDESGLPFNEIDITDIHFGTKEYEEFVSQNPNTWELIKREVIK